MRIRRALAMGAASAGSVGLVFGTMLAMAAPAGATIDNTRGGMSCTGQATITPKGKAPYTIDANQSEAHVPKEAGPVQYTGGTNPISHDHSGEVKVDLGPLGVSIYSWKSKNDGNKPSDAGTANWPSQMKNAPPGKYYVTGTHSAKEGGCSGHMTLIIDGSPLSSPAADLSLAGTVVSGVLVLVSGLAKKGALARG